MQKDTLNQKFISFKNEVVTINKDGFTSTPNNEGDGINSDFTYEETPGNFEKFFNNITGNDPEKKKTLMAICGYLLHSHLEYDYKIFLIVLTDGFIKENEDSFGFTGKSLLLKALGKMLNTVNKKSGYIEIYGKTFKSQEDRKYQRADKDTSLIHINDIYHYLDLKPLLTDINEGIIVREMYEKPFQIDSKIVLSCNQNIMLGSHSLRAYVKVFELSRYYNEKLTPEIEFKQWFFRDWDATEWNKFYSFIIRCCIAYFNNKNLSVCAAPDSVL